MRDCGRRAMQAAFRYSGHGNISIPDLPNSDALREFIEEFPSLEYIDDRIPEGNYPVLVLYRDNYIGTDGEYHAVFMSDLAPAALLERIHSMVIGWDEFSNVTLI